VFYARTFALVTLFILGALSYRILVPVYAALAWAALIAFLLHPLHVRLTKLLRGHKSLSAGLLTLLAILIVLGPITGLAAAFVVQAEDVLKMAQGFASQQIGAQGTAGAGRLMNSLLSALEDNFGVTPAQIQGWATDAARTVLRGLASVGGRIFVGALGTALSFTISMFVVFFLLRDGAEMLRMVRGLVPMPRPDKRHLFDHLSSVVHAVIYGTGLTALIQGIMLGAAFAVLGLPAPVVIGVLSTIVALLPLVGTPGVWVPTVIILALQGRWVVALIMLVWGLIISTIDNVLRPILVAGRGAQIGTLTVFIGVSGGASALGAVGLFLGPVVLSMGIALARFTLELRHPHSDVRSPLLPPGPQPPISSSPTPYSHPPRNHSEPL
jgi:predicted PurR-regulated permease PerM